MLAIYKKEVRSALCGMIGCVMIAVMLAILGFFVSVENIASGDPRIEVSLYDAVILFVFVIIMPFFTMRTLAEEKRTKTEQLLLSLPVSVKKTVLAKYLAVMTIVGIPMVIVAFYPLVLKLFDTVGAVNLATAYSSWLALLLMLAAMAAMGMFASSLVENQIIAAIITVGMFFALYFTPTLAAIFPKTPTSSLIALIIAAVILGVVVIAVTKNSTAACIATGVPAAACIIVYAADRTLFSGLFGNILSSLSFFQLYGDGAMLGLFDLTAVVYYISIAALFLFFTMMNMERRRYI